MSESNQTNEQQSAPDGAAMDAVFWKYSNWPNEIARKAVDFKVKYGGYPNCLSAAKPTLDKLTHAATGGQVKHFTGDLADRENRNDLGQMELSRIKNHFRQCRSYSLDEIIEYGVSQLFTGGRIVTPFYTLVLQVDDTAQENVYRLRYKAGIEDGLSNWEKRLDEQLQEDDGEQEDDLLQADDAGIAGGAEEISEADKAMLLDLLRRMPQYKAGADLIESNPVGFLSGILAGAIQDKDLMLKAESLFFKKHLVVTMMQKLHGLKPQDSDRERVVPIDVKEVGEELGFTDEDVFAFFEDPNLPADELLCGIMYLTESDNLSPRACEVQGDKISFVYPIEKDKMQTIAKGGHAKELDDSCQKVAGLFKSRFEWKGDVQFVFSTFNSDL